MKALLYTMLGILFISIFAIGYSAYLLFYPFKTFEAVQPYRVITPVVQNGGELQYEADYCKYRSFTPSSVSKTLVGDDGYVYSLPVSVTAVFQKGCGKSVITNPIVLPEKFNFDQKYRLEITVSIPLNILRTETLELKTESFKITK